MLVVLFTFLNLFDKEVSHGNEFSWNWNMREGRLGKMAKCQIGRKPFFARLAADGSDMLLSQTNRQGTLTVNFRKTWRRNTPGRNGRWSLELHRRGKVKVLCILQQPRVQATVRRPNLTCQCSTLCWVFASTLGVRFLLLPGHCRGLGDVWLESDVSPAWCNPWNLHLKACGCWLWRVLTQRPRQAIDGFAKRREEQGIFLGIVCQHLLCRMPGEERRGRRMFCFAESFVLIGCKVQSIHRVQNASKSWFRPLEYAQQRGDVEVLSLDAMRWASLHVLTRPERERLLVDAMHCRYLSSSCSCRLLKAFLWAQHWKQLLGVRKWISTPSTEACFRVLGSNERKLGCLGDTRYFAPTYVGFLMSHHQNPYEPANNQYKRDGIKDKSFLRSFCFQLCISQLNLPEYTRKF